MATRGFEPRRRFRDPERRWGPNPLSRPFDALQAPNSPHLHSHREKDGLGVNVG